MSELKAKANARLAQLKDLGETKANIYGNTQADGLNVFYMLMDKPEVYGQPSNPVVPQRRLFISSLTAIAASLFLGLAALISFRERGKKAEVNA